MTIFWESLARLILRMEMIGDDENDNKPEPDDADMILMRILVRCVYMMLRM